MSDKPSSDNKVLVSSEHFYIRINKDDHTQPWGKEVILINEKAGRRYEGRLSRSDTFATHYASYPRFRKGEDGQIL